MTYPNTSAVLLTVLEKDNRLKVQLTNRRTRGIAQTAEMLGPERTRDILRALLGLCPVAQMSAFDAACKALTDQSTSDGWIKHCNVSQKLVTAEAILETIRVLSMDVQPFTIHGKVSQESLKTIGELRARLWGLSANCSVDNVLLENFLEDLKALVILWFTREKVAINAIKHTFERFDDIVLNGRCLLFPEEITPQAILNLFVQILDQYPDWALCPQLAGSRIPGALARIRSVQSQGRRNNFCIRDMVLARLQELKNYAAGLPSEFRVQGINLGNGWSVGLAETARGSLMHFLNLEKGKMRFHIVAPTEWAFQEDSPMVEAMNTYANKRASAVKSIVTGLNLIACAFDPCTKINVTWPKRDI